jgi:hypothetical protein
MNLRRHCILSSYLPEAFDSGPQSKVIKRRLENHFIVLFAVVFIFVIRGLLEFNEGLILIWSHLFWQSNSVVETRGEPELWLVVWLETGMPGSYSITLSDLQRR